MMIKFILIFFSLFFFNSCCKAQIQKHIFIDYTNKDLNNDKILDYFEIEKIRCNDNEDDDMKCRVVKIDLLKENGTSLFYASNYHIVPCLDCNEDGSDPFKKLKIRKNSFSFILIYKLVPEGTKITKIITFKYNKVLNNFILHKKITTTKSYKNEQIKRKIETSKDFGQVYFSDYR